MTERTLGRRWMIGLLAFVGINALVAAYGFVGDPDGSSIGIPQEWLEDSPFRDYLVPGLVLGAMGLLSLTAAFLQLRRHEYAWLLAGVAGVGFVIWIVVQSIMMGSFRHPVQTTLQAVVITIGFVVSALAALQYRAWQFARGSPRIV
jgi:hypothetical protein